MTCLHCQIMDLIQNDVRKREAEGGRYSLGEIIHALAEVVIDTVHSAPHPVDRLALLIQLSREMQKRTTDNLAAERSDPPPSPPDIEPTMTTGTKH